MLPWSFFHARGPNDPPRMMSHSGTDLWVGMDGPAIVHRVNNWDDACDEIDRLQSEAHGRKGAHQLALAEWGVGANGYDHLGESANESCSCGGGGPSDGCGACRLYHAAKELGVERDEARGVARVMHNRPDWPSVKAAALTIAKWED